MCLCSWATPRDVHPDPRSLFSTWDNQFYPGIEGWLVKLDRQPDGTYTLDPDFFVDFHEQADGARPHEIHLPGGDCTTEIFQ